jgi:hypothetical protein
MDFDQYGEKALMETKENREFQAKIREIEDRLSAFHNYDTPQVKPDTVQYMRYVKFPFFFFSPAHIGGEKKCSSHL